MILPEHKHFSEIEKIALIGVANAVIPDEIIDYYTIDKAKNQAQQCLDLITILTTYEKGAKTLMNSEQNG